MAVIISGHLAGSLVATARNGDISVEASSSGLTPFVYSDGIIAIATEWAPATGDVDLSGLAAAGFDVVGADNPITGAHHLRHVELEWTGDDGTFTIETGGTNGVGADFGLLTISSGANGLKTARWSGNLTIDSTHKTVAVTNASSVAVKATFIFAA